MTKHYDHRACHGNFSICFLISKFMNSSYGLGLSSTQLILFFLNSWALQGSQEMECGVDVQMVRGSS